MAKRFVRRAERLVHHFIVRSLTPEGTNAQLRLMNHYILLDGL